jgi:hypothetical protein
MPVQDVVSDVQRVSRKVSWGVAHIVELVPEHPAAARGGGDDADSDGQATVGRPILGLTPRRGGGNSEVDDPLCDAGGIVAVFSDADVQSQKACKMREFSPRPRNSSAFERAMERGQQSGSVVCCL